MQWWVGTIAGCSLTGAGGGGFLAAILKTPEDRGRVEDIIRGCPVREAEILCRIATVHSMRLC